MSDAPPKPHAPMGGLPSRCRRCWHWWPCPESNQGEENVSDDERLKLGVRADLLAEGYDPDEISIAAVAVRTAANAVRDEANFTLIAKNLDRPDAERYGTHSDGTPKYAPEWYAVHDAATGAIERLNADLRAVLRCGSVGGDGRRCVGSILHPMTYGHWDGDGNNWDDAGASS